MFYKYLLEQKHLNKIKKVPIESFSYTKLIDEPSLLHSHGNCELIIALNDNGYVILNNNKVNLSTNDILIVSTNVMHTEKNIISGSSFEYFSLKLNITLSNQISDFEIINTSSNSKLVFYLKTAYENLTKNDDEYLAILNLSIFFLTFQKILDNKNIYISNVTKKFIPYYVTDAKNYIINNYGKNISVSELAEKYNISQTLFCNKFKEYLNLTPKEFIIKTRIDYSMHLLLTTSYSVAQIADLCGFKSPAYFTKTFKEVTKILPKHYRENN